MSEEDDISFNNTLQYILTVFLQYYLHHINNSHQQVEFVIYIIYNIILSCWYPDGVD